MAQQNQAQTAIMIILGILTLVAVTTSYFLGRGYAEQAAMVKETKSQLAKVQSDYRSLSNDAGKLKKWIGFADEATPITDIESAFTNDMKIYAPVKTPEGAAPVLESYRVALGQVSKSLETEQGKNASLNRESKDLQNRLDVLNAEKQAMEVARQKEVDLAKKDLQAERTKFLEYMNVQETKIKELDTLKNKTRADAEAAIAEAKRKEAEIEQRNTHLVGINTNLTEKLVQLRTPVVTYFDTKISYVSSDNKTVWINKGSQDGLTPRISFSIYEPSSNDVSRDRSKGAIEVTRILGAHTAEAKVIEGVVSEPIMIGDLAYTPVWCPGQKLQFALSSGLDVDGDGKSDVYLVKNIIEMNGGEVVAFIDDQSGNMEVVDGRASKKVELKGAITKDTIYYVVGNDIKETDSPELQKLRRELDDNAKLNNLETIRLPELLRRMGYTERMNVEGFDFNRDSLRVNLVPGILDHSSTGNVNEIYDPRPKRQTPHSNPIADSPLFHKKGAQPAPSSSGNVSELFKPRTPPNGMDITK